MAELRSCFYMWIIWWGGGLQITYALEAAMIGSPVCRQSVQPDPQRHRCFSLYSFASQGANTWLDAYAHCLANGERLAVIPDRDTQELMTSLSHAPTQMAWISGRLSQNNTWHSLNGAIFVGYIQVSDIYAHCGVLYRAYGAREYGLVADRCNPTSRQQRLGLCAFPKEQESCPEETIQATPSLCYQLTPVPTESWFHASMQCTAMRPGAHLVDGGIMDIGDTLRTYLNRYFRARQYGVWVGLFRKPWTWVMDGERTLMTYYNWLPGHGSNHEGSSCLALSFSEVTLWKEYPCEKKINNFICEQVRQAETTTVTDIMDETSLESTTGTIFTTTAPYPHVEDCIHSYKLHTDVWEDMASGCARIDVIQNASRDACFLQACYLGISVINVMELTCELLECSGGDLHLYHRPDGWRVYVSDSLIFGRDKDGHRHTISRPDWLSDGLIMLCIVLFLALCVVISVQHCKFKEKNVDKIQTKERKVYEMNIEKVPELTKM